MNLPEKLYYKLHCNGKISGLRKKVSYLQHPIHYPNILSINWTRWVSAKNISLHVLSQCRSGIRWHYTAAAFFTDASLSGFIQRRQRLKYQSFPFYWSAATLFHCNLFPSLAFSYPVPSSAQSKKALNKDSQKLEQLTDLNQTLMVTNLALDLRFFIPYKSTICTSGELSSFHLLSGDSKLYFLWEVRSKAETEFPVLPICPHASSL